MPSTWSRGLRKATGENRADILDETFRVGSFTAHAALEAGGQGLVFLATGDTGGLSDPVVLKMFRDTSDHFIERLDRSLRLQTQVNDQVRVRGPRDGVLPAVVSFDLSAGVPWVVHRYRGVNLATRHRLERPVTDPMIAQILQAVQFLHQCGVTHRDLKPANILADSSRRFGGPEIVLCDLDLARSEGLETLTHAGGRMGTNMYSAPEQLLGTRAEAAADVYSVAAALVFLKRPRFSAAPMRVAALG